MEQKTAKIAVVKGIYDIEIQEYPIPEPDEGSILIKVEAVAICGSDKHNLTTVPKEPRTIGHEFVGRIVAMGEKANEQVHCYNGEMKIGDRIVIYPHLTCNNCEICRRYGNGTCICPNDWMYGGAKFNRANILNNCPSVWPYFKGAFAEYVYIFPNTFVWKVPDDMPSKIAVLLDPCAVGMRAVEQAMTDIGGLNEGISLTSHCLIVGDGAIGILTGMILREMGVEQLVFTGHRDAKLQLAKEITGADAVINTKYMSEEEKVAKVLEVTGGGADIVMTAGNAASATYEALQMVRPLGTIVGMGALNAGHDPEHAITNRLLFRKNAHITGVTAKNPACYDRSMSLLKRWRRLPFDKLITHEFHKLEDLASVAKCMGDDDYLKAVLTFEE